ncbi:hypothetical protein [uncultured Actinomyces sp.]
MDVGVRAVAASMRRPPLTSRRSL